MSRRKRSKQRADRRGSNGAKNRRKRETPKRNKEHLANLFEWLLQDDSIFAKIKLHGNTKWRPKPQLRTLTPQEKKKLHTLEAKTVA